MEVYKLCDYLTKYTSFKGVCQYPFSYKIELFIALFGILLMAVSKVLLFWCRQILGDYSIFMAEFQNFREP